MTPQAFAQLSRQAEDNVRVEARTSALRKLAQMVDAGWCEEDARAQIIEWSCTSEFDAFACQRVREETRRLIAPDAPTVVLQ
jgi:hypothetical protein